MNGPRLILLCFGVLFVASHGFAGPPAGTAAKLIASPLVEGPNGDTGLPPVACGGFAWWVPIPPLALEPGDEVTLALAIIPFRDGPTSIRFTDTGPAFITLVGFVDGLVAGLPYDRNGWNEVRVTLRPATQDYMVEVNGRTSAPLPFSDDCGSHGGCHAPGAFAIGGDFLHESVGWVDSITLSAGPIDNEALQLDMSFDGTCSAPQAGVGAILLANPPRRLRSQ